MIIKNIVFTGILMLTTLSVEAKTIFALNNQYFSETMPKEKSKKSKDGNMIGARYDVGDVIVSTNLSRWNSGVLGTLPERSDGYFSIDLKQPIQNWVVSANVSYYFFNGCHQATSYSIRLGADNGESIYITTNSCDVVINDNKFTLSKHTLRDVPLNYFIKTKGDTIIVKLNGQTLVTLPKGEFDTLATIELTMASPLRFRKSSHIKNLVISQK